MPCQDAAQDNYSKSGNVLLQLNIEGALTKNDCLVVTPHIKEQSRRSITAVSERLSAANILSDIQPKDKHAATCDAINKKTRWTGNKLYHGK